MSVENLIIIGIKMKKEIDIKYSFNEDRPCSLCKIIKSASKFTSRKLPSGNYGRMSRCKECNAKKATEKRKRRSQEERDIINKKLREYHKSRPNKTKEAWHKSNITRRFSELGFTQEKYKEMFIMQDGKCAICKEQEREFANDGELKRLSVDHCHKKNKIRELLCSRCNKALGSFKDDVNLLKSAIIYLEKHNG
jgi:hypothetical protein